MQIINPSVELWLQENTINGIWEHAAKCARVCYQSQPVNKEESAKDFLLRTIAKNGFKKDKSSHMSVLEHATVYLFVNRHDPFNAHMYNKYSNNPYSKTCNFIINDNIEGLCITTNLRVLVENNWFDDLDYVAYNISQHIKRYTFNIITNIGVSRELNRHRCHSISEESTRYCNYSKDKFGNELTFVIPEWSDLEEGTVTYDQNFESDPYEWDYYINGNRYDSMPFDESKGSYYFSTDFIWLVTNKTIESAYITLLARGQKPQQAREVLPLSLKTQVIHTAFEDDWEEFINLRYYGVSGEPHPNIKVVAKLIHEFLTNKN